MLNPDGAERFQRRNAQGVDVKVALLDPVFGLDLPADLWRPNDFGRPSDDVGR